MELVKHNAPFPLEHYKFEKPLGHGGQGIVLLYSRKDNVHLYLPQTVAVKSIPIVKAKWSRELEIMSIITANPHPNIVKCYGYCQEQEDSVSIVMEAYDTDLRKYLANKDGPCTVSETKVILKQLAAALTHLKEYNIVHRGNGALCFTNSIL